LLNVFETVAARSATAVFVSGAPMNYPAFTNQSLTMMYEGIRGALAADDAFENEGREPPFRVRETAEWKNHAVDLEAEMLKRGMLFELIQWSKGELPLQVPTNREAKTCAFCEPMCACSETQLADRLTRMRQIPDLPVVPCSKCGNTDWATTDKFIVRRDEPQQSTSEAIRTRPLRANHRAVGG
jgi:hypothetical protein